MNNLERLFNQTIVLWTTPVNNGYGGYTFAAPVEIQGRWEDKLTLNVSVNRDEQVDTAVIYTLATVEKENWVYLGNLTDLTTEQKANPKLIDTAYLVKGIEIFTNIGGVFRYRKVKV